MGLQIIRQPDGLYAVRSSETETVILWDASPAEVEQWWVEMEAARARTEVLRILRHVDDGHPEKTFHQFTRTWTQALADDRARLGQAWRCFTDDGTRLPEGQERTGE